MTADGDEMGTPQFVVEENDDGQAILKAEQAGISIAAHVDPDADREAIWTALNDLQSEIAYRRRDRRCLP